MHVRSLRLRLSAHVVYQSRTGYVMWCNKQFWSFSSLTRFQFISHPSVRPSWGQADGDHIHCCRGSKGHGKFTHRILHEPSHLHSFLWLKQDLHLHLISRVQSSAALAWAWKMELAKRAVSHQGSCLKILLFFFFLLEFGRKNQACLMFALNKTPESWTVWLEEGLKEILNLLVRGGNL